jgi:Ni/Co efflux regulator RcnB
VGDKRAAGRALECGLRPAAIRSNSLETATDLIMLAKKYLPHLMFTALCAMGSLAHAAEEPSVKLDRPGYGVKELKEGDNAPDQYQRPDLALKDWRARHLSEPGDDKQWVEIHDQYALIDIPTGTIRQMVPKAKAHK